LRHVPGECVSVLCTAVGAFVCALIALLKTDTLQFSKLIVISAGYYESRCHTMYITLHYKILQYITLHVPLKQELEPHTGANPRLQGGRDIKNISLSPETSEEQAEKNSSAASIA
jgi:hypothetical protein